MKKNIKSVIAVAAALLLLAIIGFIYIFRKPDRNATNMNPAFSGDAMIFYNKYDNNENLGNRIYLGKPIEISGTIIDISELDNGDLTVVLGEEMEMGGVSCTFKKSSLSAETKAKIELEKKIKAKGFCSGLLMEVVLVDCVIMDEK